VIAPVPLDLADQQDVASTNTAALDRAALGAADKASGTLCAWNNAAWE